MSEELSELDQLKKQAAELNISHSPNIGVDTLKEKIDEALKEKEEKKEDDSDTSDYKTNPKSRQKLIQKAKKLIRVNVVCMNPNKKDMKGQYFSFENSIVSTITRFVPFDTDTHVESALLNIIKSRKFARTRMVKGNNGVPYPDRALVNEFNIEMLEPLTEEELQDLAADQAKRGAIDK